MQVERAGPAGRRPLGDPALPRLGGVTQLAGQDAASLQAEAAPLRRRGYRQPMEPVLRRRVEVVRPGDYLGAGRRGAEACDVAKLSGDPKVVVEPVRVRQRQYTAFRGMAKRLPCPSFLTGLSLSSLARRT